MKDSAQHSGICSLIGIEMTIKELKDLVEVMSLSQRMDKHMSFTEAEECKKNIFNEMAYERNMFKAILTNLSVQIIQNWCLIRFARLNNLDEGLVNHWKSELVAHINNAASNKIKENNSFQSRAKAIREVWVDEKEYAIDSNVIKLTIHAKFKNESFDVTCDAYKQTIQDCMTESDKLIQAIASENADTVEEYVNSL